MVRKRSFSLETREIKKTDGFLKNWKDNLPLTV